MAKYEHYDGGAAAAFALCTTDWVAQTFTPQANHVLRSVKLDLRRDSGSGTLTVGIRATAAGKPTGADLGSGTISTLPDSFGWVCININPDVNVSNGTMYAIVFRRTSGDLQFSGRGKTNMAGPDPYTRGENYFSADGGAPWVSFGDVIPGAYADLNFEEWDEECVPPVAPSGLNITSVEYNQIDLEWIDNSNDEDGFKIERSVNDGAYSYLDSVGADVTTYSDTSVLPDTKYCYRVYAYSAGGDSGYSNVACDTTPLPSSPTAPSNLIITNVEHNQIDLGWTDNSDNETGFKIERSIGGGAFAHLNSVGANETTYSDTIALADTEYSYRVYAYNAGGNSDYSNSAGTTTPVFRCAAWPAGYSYISPTGHTEANDPGVNWTNPGQSYDKDCDTEGLVSVRYRGLIHEDSQMTWHFDSITTDRVYIEGSVYNNPVCDYVGVKVDGAWITLEAYGCRYFYPNGCWSFTEGVLTDFRILIRHMGGGAATLHIYEIAARVQLQGTIYKNCRDQDGGPMVGIEVDLRDNGNIVDTEITNESGVAVFHVNPGLYYFDVNEDTLPNDYKLVGESGPISVGSGATGYVYNFFKYIGLTSAPRTYFFLA